jgi:hypothetical protein
VFRRRRSDDDEETPRPEDAVDAVNAADAASDGTPVAGSELSTAGGPWDVADAPEGPPRVDLGALRVPVPDRMDMRLDVQEQVVVAATLVEGRATLQVHAFAAPKSGGIWADVRREIAESIRSSGGTAEEQPGPFGTELLARVPAEGPNAPPGLQPIRFIGQDGPRWFLRGLLTGPAATDPAQARRLEAAFRDIVVVRGGEAMAPRDLIPLRLPKEALAAAEAAEAAAELQRPGLEMLERGPEITETR